MKITTRQIVLSILAIFVMFLPRKVSIFGVFSFRVFIIIAALMAFLLLGIRIKFNGVLRMPTFWIYIGIVAAIQLVHGEYTTLFGTLLDTVVLCLVLNSCLSDRKDLDFFIRLFLYMLIIYSAFCAVETATGFSPWSLFGAKVNSYVRFGVHRSFGAYTTSINNGVFLLLTFPLTWYAQKFFSDKRLATAALVATWIALICTLSRGPILFAILLNIIIVWKSGIFRFFKRNFVKIIFAAVIFAFILLIPAVRSNLYKFFTMFFAIFDPSVAQGIKQDFGSNAEGLGQRTMLYSWVWQDLGTHKLFGLGANTPMHHVWRPNQYNTAIKESIENFYLATLYHYGIVGLTALVAFLTESSVWSFMKYRVEKKVFLLKKASESIHFRVCITFFCYFGTVFTVSSIDDFKMFLILLVFSDAYSRFIVKARRDENTLLSSAPSN